MVGVKQSTDTNGSRGYYLPASLVNKLIVTIFASLLSLAGYMILWAYQDIRFKTSLEGRMDAMSAQVSTLEEHVDPRNHPDGELRRELAKQSALLAALSARQAGMSNQLDRIEGTLDGR